MNPLVAAVLLCAGALIGWVLGRRRGHSTPDPSIDGRDVLTTAARSIDDLVQGCHQRERRLIHDLRSSMTGVLGQLSLAEAAPAKAAHHVRKAIDAAEHMRKRLDEPAIDTRWRLSQDSAGRIDLGESMRAWFPTTINGHCEVPPEVAVCISLMLAVAEAQSVTVSGSWRTVEAVVGEAGLGRERTIAWLGAGIDAAVSWSADRLTIQLLST